MRQDLEYLTKKLVSDDILYIAGFWDTRCEPNEQRDQTIARIESDES